MTRRRIGRRALRAASLACAVGTLLGAMACDPCAGVPSCRGDAQLSYTGRVIDFPTGRGVAGVTVVFRRQSGVSLGTDSLVAVTDADGRYLLRAGAGSVGAVVGDLHVVPPAGAQPYDVANVSLATSDVRGNGGVMPTYLARPYVSYVASIYNRRAQLPANSAHVVFVRRGGARLVHDTIETNADPTGFFYLQAAALEPGDVVGDIIANGEFLDRTYVIQNVTLDASVLDRLPAVNAQFLVGSTLDYALLVRYRGTAAPAVGAVVEFRRTGGVPLTQAAYTATVGADGRVVFQLDPANEQAGEVVGDVTVRAPLLSRPYVVHGVHLATFDATELRFGGVLNVGYAVESAGELFFRGDRAPLGGADVQFVRTGGLATTPSTFSTRSLSDGRFGVIVTTDTVGDVVGDLIVRRDSSSAPVRFTGVHLPAVADDSVRYMGRFALGAQILYNGVLVQRATQAPAAGWTVVFRRTGGIPLVVDTLASTVVDWGGFALDPSTRAEGAVDGTLEAHAPNGGPAIPLGPVHLQTFDDDSVRLAGRWAIGPSLLYVGELRRADNDAVVVGARVEFRRTGGIAVAESVLVSQSNFEGRFRLAPTPLAEGEVIGALHIVPPAPLRDTTITDVHLTTFDTDEVRLGGVWRLVP